MVKDERFGVRPILTIGVRTGGKGAHESVAKAGRVDGNKSSRLSREENSDMVTNLVDEPEP